MLEGPLDVERSSAVAGRSVSRPSACSDARGPRARAAPGGARARSLRRARGQEHPSRRPHARGGRGARRGAQSAPRARAHKHGPAPRREERSGARGRCAPARHARRATIVARHRGLRPGASRSAVLGARNAAGSPRPALANDTAARARDGARAGGNPRASGQLRSVRAACWSTLRARFRRPRTSVSSTPS